MTTVLIVDDSKFMRMSLGDIITSLGCEVIACDNGLTAITMYERYRPDLITIDILMPDQDGIETLEQLLNLDPQAVAVMVTALGMEDYIDESMKRGARGCIIKPFSKEQIRQVLKCILGEASVEDD